MIPGREAALGLHHPDLLGRPYADQLAHQVTLQKHIESISLFSDVNNVKNYFRLLHMNSYKDKFC